MDIGKEENEMANAFVGVDKKEKDAINPSHYKNYPVESIEMMLRVFGPTATYWHCILTAYKYRMRLGHKDEIKQELEKESWYLNKAAELKENFKHDILTKI